MFRSSMRSSSGSFLFISLWMLLILKIIKILNILIICNISNIDKEKNKKLPEDDLIEDRNVLE
jgi:competence protein ComGC